MLPVTKRGTASVEPAGALAGFSDVVAGMGKFVAGAVTEKLTAFENTDPFETVTGTCPWVSVSVYGIMAVSCVELTNVVLEDESGIGLLFQ